jgi:membrane-bound ClpP family serine protease
MNSLLPVDQQVKDELGRLLDDIGIKLNADIMAISSPIYPGLENRVRLALEPLTPRKSSLGIILETPGGVVEVVERMVTTVRHLYKEVIFIVPNRAMSAGTVFVMSGDRILMDYFSCLGPIDPQIEKEGRFIPALSYLLEFERLNAKAAAGKLTPAEFALIDKLDLAELHQFQQARELSVELLEKWLSNYKFKNWTVTTTGQKQVTPAMKKQRAKEIAEKLSKNDRWHSHGRGIDVNVLRDELNLQVEDLVGLPDLHKAVAAYFYLISDYIRREKHSSFVHTREYF